LPNKQEKNKKIRAYSKYSGLAYQLFGLLALTIFLGMKADKYFGNETQYITGISSILVLFAFFYKLIIDLNLRQ